MLPTFRTVCEARGWNHFDKIYLVYLASSVETIQQSLHEENPATAVRAKKRQKNNHQLRFLRTQRTHLIVWKPLLGGHRRHQHRFLKANALAYFLDSSRMQPSWVVMSNLNQISRVKDMVKEHLDCLKEIHWNP